ncbi:MAG: hypothetical protein GF308_13425 [Candidatus Heimdallarchaeota archaeon]|nr:hypothetical protein [Candidatus Heimdallarchaeota archaeon]
MFFRKKRLLVIILINFIIFQVAIPFIANSSLSLSPNLETDNQKHMNNPQSISEREFLMGMNPHPRQFGNESLSEEEQQEYMDEAFNLGKSSMELYPRWPSIKWYELKTKMPSEHFQLYKEAFGWLPMIYVKTVEYYLAEDPPGNYSWHIKPLLSSNQPEGLKFNDSQFIEDVSAELTEFCTMDPGPEVVFLGNEINQIYEIEGEQTFFEYADGMKQIAQNVRMAEQVSEQLKLGVVLSHTQMLVNITSWEPWSKDRLWMIECFNGENGLDIIGLNSYPFKSNYANPEDIPAEYYTQIEQYTTNPIWFTEIAWPSGADYNSSEEEQATFLTHFIEITKNMNLEALCWISMHDFSDSTMYEDHVLSWGLRDVNSNPKQAWNVWQDLFALNVTGPMQSYLPIPGSTASPSSMATVFFILFFGVTPSLICATTVILVIRKKRRKKE